jgi:hypothetical protein
MPAADSDQVRFILPAEDEDAVLIHFEGMTTDPNGGQPSNQPFTTAPTATNPNLSINGEYILKDGQGITVTEDSATGDLLIEFDSGTVDTYLDEFDDALPSPTEDIAQNTVMHIEFAVIYGAGRGLSHKPDYIHTAHYRGDPTNSSRVMLRAGLSDRNRMIPTYLNDSPHIQTGNQRNLSRTSEIMIDPGSKTAYVAPYRNMLLPPLVARDGSQLNWTDATTFQGAMPTLNQTGTATVHTTVDPLNLFYVGVQTRYTEIPLKFLPRPGLHHCPIIPVTTSRFPSGINFLFMSKEGPFTDATKVDSDFNRNLVSYPSTAGYYIVTPETGETYGTGTLPSIFGEKYTNNNLRAEDGGPFKGIRFPHFMGPARITGVYLRDTSGAAPHPTTPTNTPFSTDRVFVGGSGTDTNLLHDTFDGPTFLLDVDINGDLTFILNADALDLNKAPSGTTFDNSEFIIECTLFGYDRGFLQTNGRVLVARTSGGGSIPISVNAFTTATDNKVGIIAPAPLTFDATNNEVTIYYSRQPYQGDVFGSQSSYSDDVQRLGPLSISEANSVWSNPLGPVSTLALNNKTAYEVLAATNFVTSLGSGRLSGSNPIPLLTPAQNPNTVPDYEGTLVDLNRRFTTNRVGFEDWATPKFPVLASAFTSRPSISRDGVSEVFDRDVNPEFAGCTAQLPLGIYFRDKDFVGKTLYQIRSAGGVGVAALGSISFPVYQAPTNPASPGDSTWEGTEFVTGQASGTSGVGGEITITVDGTSSFSDITNFKTARGGAGWSFTGPWPGGPITSRMPKARPNDEVGSVLVGTAYLVRSQPELVNTVEVHHGQELQMVIVTQATPAYFRDTDILHSAGGAGEGFTAVDRFRLWGRPLEKRRAETDISSAVPGEEPLFVNDIYDDPIFYGSADPSLAAAVQEILPITANGQTAFSLSFQPTDPTTVMAFVRGVKLTYGIDYIISGVTDQDFTYIVHAANPALLTTDTLEVWYNRL